MNTPRVIRATVFLGIAAMLVAGCASSKKSSGGTPTAAAPTASSAAAAGSGGAAAPAGAATVSAKTGALGTYLTDGSGRTLYLYTPDTTSTSTCYGECLANWPALLTSGGPQAAGGAVASMLGTSPRTDGSNQVTYNGHPLYYFKGDKAAGDTKGEGLAGTWYLVTTGGAKIAAASPASAPSASASSAASRY